MTSTRWRKVLRDLWGNKTRTLLVVLSIAVGVFAIGMVSGAQVLLSRGLTENYLATNPPSAALFTDRFDDDQVQVVRKMQGVGEAEGAHRLAVRVQAAPDPSLRDAAQSARDAAQVQWQTLVLYAPPTMPISASASSSPLAATGPRRNASS